MGHIDQRTEVIHMAKGNLRLVSSRASPAQARAECGIADARIAGRVRSQLTDQSREGQSARPARRHDDPNGVYAWSTRGRVGRSVMGSGGPGPQRVLARAPSQEWHARRAPVAG